MIDKFKARIEVLIQQRNQAQARLNQAIADITAIDGAIQELNFWIGRLQNEIDNQTDSQGDSEDNP